MNHHSAHSAPENVLAQARIDLEVLAARFADVAQAANATQASTDSVDALALEEAIASLEQSALLQGTKATALDAYVADLMTGQRERAHG